MTDDERLSDPLAAARALPRGSMVVIRTRQRAHRVKLAQAVLALARTRHLFVLIAGDAPLAALLGADGLHLPEALAHTAAHWRALHPRWLISVASHGRALPPSSADAVFLSGVFATPSHPDRTHLGAVRASLIAARSPKAVYALGGIDARNAVRLSPAFVGIAGIGALAV
jgi:thiamine-phosphate pyrophosphorylase